MNFLSWGFDLPEKVTEEVIREQIHVIGTHYLYDLEVDATSIRIKDALAAFDEIADLAEQLADRLSGLSALERTYLTASADFDQDGNEWVEEVVSSLPTTDLDADRNKMKDGAGAQWLRRLSKYTHFARGSIDELAEAASTRKGDVGGRFNLNRILQVPPNWVLVEMCWRLFEWTPHRQPSGTAHGPLHEFMCHVHEWVTSENVLGTSKFESHLKAFAKPWQNRKKCLQAYADFKDSLPFELQRAVDSALRGSKSDLRSLFPEQVLKQAEKLDNDVVEAELRLRLGWR